MIIPNVNGTNFEIKTQPSKTYALSNGKVLIDALEAVKQAVFLILHTHRYEHAIYSWDYGIELSDLFGKHKGYVYPEIERRIKEALQQDDRIEDIGDFSFQSKGNGVDVTFRVKTIYGGFESEVSVNV